MNRRTFTSMLVGIGKARRIGGEFADITFLDEEGLISPVITLHQNAPRADRVLVEIFYRIKLPAASPLPYKYHLPGEILHSFLSVISAVPTVPVASDPIPAAHIKIAWIKLTLVRDIQEMTWNP